MRTQQFSQGTQSGVNVTVAGQTPSSFLDYFYYILALIVIFSTVFFVSSSKRKSVWTTTAREDPKSKVLLRVFLAIVAAFFGLVILGLYLVPRTNFPIIVTPLIAMTYAQLVQFAIVVTACSVIALSLYLYYRTKNRYKNNGLLPNNLNPADELLNIFQNAADKLDEQNVSYRDTIIGCYKQVLILFERLGIPQRSNLTPREFENEITKIIGVSFPQLGELTLLFERAKYSNEELSSEDVGQAKDSLSIIGHELEKRLHELVIPAVSK
jgi:Domain of unknown function (DUF4129)